MAYRTILLELVDDAQNEARIRCGLQLAERFGAELVSIHVSLPPLAPVGYGEGNAFIGPEMFEAQREANRLVRERVEAAFRRGCARAQVPARDIYDEGDPGDILAEAARTVELMVATQPGGGFEGGIRHPIDQVILGAGGPVLMLPRAGWAEPLGRRVVVAWNGSREAARALKDSLPFLVTAEAVTVAAAGETATAGLDAAVALVRRHGVDATVSSIELGPRVGATLLEAAEALGCDLMVMGAYGHSRLREVVLGGATREVLRGAGLPVLFSC